LFGAHQWLIHPLFVALAWTRLYGVPRDPRLYAAFFLHDLGYVGLPNMDGPEGEGHVEWGARLMGQWFGPEWGAFCLYHSRFYARRAGKAPSRLCLADKLACAMEPWWMYLPRVVASGEVWEYLQHAAPQPGREAKYADLDLRLPAGSRYRQLRHWHREMTASLRRWVAEQPDPGMPGPGRRSILRNG